ncbi:MAG: putative zinc-binding metallopeptidase, partial [Pricia sp.]
LYKCNTYIWRMKIFRCQKCENPLYFENTKCEVCGCRLGYCEKTSTLVTLIDSSNSGDVVYNNDGKSYRYCKNFVHKACNWIISDEEAGEFCSACALNRTIPNLQKRKNLREWRKLERAKHRLVYALLRFGLPVIDKDVAPEEGLAFDFLSDKNASGNVQPVRTGHLNGLITINIAEADNVHREYMRKQMAEPYRTLIGHFRHEVGHYYWERIIRDRPEILKKFRETFGDERADYGEALKKHYENGPPKHWRRRYISKYAASHPWEDWAETWAHYLHLVDILETAFYFGITTGEAFRDNSPLKMQADFDPYVDGRFGRLLKAFVPLTFALNSLNRSMGQNDIYPFVIPKKTIKKLRFVHRLLHSKW